MILVDEVQTAIKRPSIATAKFIDLDYTLSTIADELMIFPAVKSSEDEPDEESRILGTLEEKKMAIRGAFPEEEHELMKHRMRRSCLLTENFCLICSHLVLRCAGVSRNKLGKVDRVGV